MASNHAANEKSLYLIDFLTESRNSLRRGALGFRNAAHGSCPSLLLIPLSCPLIPLIRLVDERVQFSNTAQSNQVGSPQLPRDLWQSIPRNFLPHGFPAHADRSPSESGTVKTLIVSLPGII